MDARLAALAAGAALDDARGRRAADAALAFALAGVTDAPHSETSSNSIDNVVAGQFRRLVHTQHARDGRIVL